MNAGIAFLGALVTVAMVATAMDVWTEAGLLFLPITVLPSLAAIGAALLKVHRPGLSVFIGVLTVVLGIGAYIGYAIARI